MTSEETLLRMPYVKHKKEDGVLFIMADRLTWFNKEEMVEISHGYSDMKLLKISPEGKQEIQLQIVLHDTSTFTLHFVNPNGIARQQKNRDKVKKMLMELLPKFRPKNKGKMEEKNRILSENPELLQLYKDLVVEGITTPDEFWTVYAQKYKPGTSSTVQETGVSSGFLSKSNIHPEQDGPNGISYSLTTDTIASILKTYPSVKNKHTKCVPSQMTESQFWSKFFQSHYFNCDRLPGSKDLFFESAQVDEKEMKKEIEQIALHFESEEPFKVVSTADVTNSVHKNMIKRINHHSVMILKASDKNLNASKIKLKLDDFEDISADKEKPVTKLPLLNVDRYLKCRAFDLETEVVTPEELLSVSQQMQECLTDWSDKPQLLDDSTANIISCDLTPGGELVPNIKVVKDPQLSSEVTEEIRNAYLSLTELLRLFYDCFPPSTPILEEKLKKSYDTLKKFENLKLASLKDKLLQNNLNLNLLDHFKSVLQAAHEKYAVWME